MSAEAEQPQEDTVGQSETGEDVYVGEQVFQQVLSAVQQDDAEAAFALDYDDDGELSQYGVGFGGKHGHGVYLSRKEDENGAVRFNMYQIGKHEHPTVRTASRLWNESDWAYAIRRTEQTFDRELLTQDVGASPAENQLSEEILPFFQHAPLAFSKEDGVVYTLTEDDGEQLSALAPYDE